MGERVRLGQAMMGTERRSCRFGFARTLRECFGRRLPLVGVVGALLSPALARADFQPAAYPGGDLSASIVAYAASGHDHLAQTRVAGATTAYYASHDDARSWQTVAPTCVSQTQAPALRAPITVTLDGAFATLPTTCPGAVRIDAGTGQSSQLTGPFPHTGSAAGPGFAADGAMWFADVDASQHVVIERVAADGTIAEMHIGPAWDFQPLSVAVDADGPLAYTAQTTYALQGNGTIATQPARGPGTLLPSGVALGDAALRRPGNAQYALVGAVGSRVEGDAAHRFISGRLLTLAPDGSAISYAGQSTPLGATRIIAAGGQLTAVSDQSATNRGAVVHGVWALPRSGTDPGYQSFPAGLPPDAQTMIDRANQLRAAVGFPGLIVDAQISQAAVNHSTYWTLNPAPSALLSYHEETPGNPGFTGIYPWDRCQAAGTACGGEIMFPGLSGAAAVDGWIATPYHRGPLMNPSALVVGAATAQGGPAVVDSGASPNVWLAPSGYPSGNYAGPGTFGGEAPDPRAACRTLGQPISAPSGAPVSLYAPAGTTAVSVSLSSGDGTSLAGCHLDSSTFMPDAPLAPGTTYRATGIYQDTSGGAQNTYKWQFTTPPSAPVTPPRNPAPPSPPSPDGTPTTPPSPPSPDGTPTSRTCRVSVQAPTRARTTHTLNVAATICAPGIVSVRLRRHGTRHNLVTKTVRGRRAATIHVRFGHPPVGRLTIAVTAPGGTATRSVQIDP